MLLTHAKKNLYILSFLVVSNHYTGIRKKNKYIKLENKIEYNSRLFLAEH